jgi:SAM-dependent methyltransferase
MKVRPYAVLAPYYHKEWTSFSMSYLSIIKKLGLRAACTSLSVLDVGCGTGVLAAAMTEAGFTAVGVDVSPEMLQVARASFPKIEFICADMQDLHLGRKFCLAICAFDALNYLSTPASLHTAFRCIADHLEPGGHFLFDVNTAKLYERNGTGAIHRCVDGQDFDQIWTYDASEKTARTVFNFPNGDTEEHIQRTYEEEDIEAALAGTQLQVVRTFGGDDLQPPPKDCSKVYFLTQRVG